MPLAFASASMRSIWWQLPSTSATQSQALSGSLRLASSKTSAITSFASSTTLAMSHLLAAFGALAAASSSPERAITCSGVRACGATV